jgi:DinB superfamily
VIVFEPDDRAASFQARSSLRHVALFIADNWIYLGGAELGKRIYAAGNIRGMKSMESAGLVADTLGRVRDMVQTALKDLSPEELLASPKPPIAWLVWHLSRVQDANFSGLMERPQLWIADGWHARFNMAPEPRDYGSGHRHTREQVEAFAVNDKQLLLDYLDTVFARTKGYLSTVSNVDLNRVLNEPQYHPLPTLSVRLASVINCNTRHAGQIEYLRGLIKHQGWFPATEK